jgi:hypothetical protein
MNGKPPEATFALNSNQVTVTVASNEDALAFLNWLQFAYTVTRQEPSGPLIGRPGHVCARAGVVTVNGLSEMQTGGAVPAVIVEQCDDWFKVETSTGKSFAFDPDTLEQIDGDRWFEFEDVETCEGQS